MSLPTMSREFDSPQPHQIMPVDVVDIYLDYDVIDKLVEALPPTALFVEGEDELTFWVPGMKIRIHHHVEGLD